MSAGCFDYDPLPTEQASKALRWLDVLGAQELVDLIHEQDRLALAAVGRARRAIARAATAAARTLAGGGRLIYVGAGTSGRLAALDAAECPPTFGTHPSQVVAVMAGGRTAMWRAREGAEDSRREGRLSMQRLEVGARDWVCGVSASGATRFVLAALEESRRRGARTALITCGPRRLVASSAELLICLDVGAEIVAGSTRMKAGLATKAVLHALSTTAMIQLGKVYDNLMVEVSPKSRKLERRAVRIVQRLTALDEKKAARLLVEAGGTPKVAAVMHHRQISRAQAQRLLVRHGQRLRAIIGEVDHGT